MSKGNDDVLTGPPEAILGILRSAQSGTPDPRLGNVLEGFRRHWLALGRRRYPQLQDDLEDAVQTALLKLVSNEKLDTLRDADRLEARARGPFGPPGAAAGPATAAAIHVGAAMSACPRTTPSMRCGTRSRTRPRAPRTSRPTVSGSLSCRGLRRGSRSPA